MVRLTLKFEELNGELPLKFEDFNGRLPVTFRDLYVVGNGPNCEDCVKSVNGVTPDENGNVTVSAMPNDLEQITMLVDADMLPAVHLGGAILTDNSGRVILRY